MKEHKLLDIKFYVVYSGTCCTVSTLSGATIHATKWCWLSDPAVLKKLCVNWIHWIIGEFTLYNTRRWCHNTSGCIEYECQEQLGTTFALVPSGGAVSN